MIEQVYNQYYDTAGNYHWIGVHFGEHILRKGEKMLPTQKQIEFAKDIHDELGIPLPKENTKEAYMTWLNRNVPKYRKFCQDRQLEHEVHVDAIDGRRDWQ